MGPRMAADITAFVDRIVGAGKIIGVEIDQMGIGRGCSPADQRHAVGIVTKKTWRALANNMAAMARKGGLKPVEQNRRVVATKTEGVVALGIH